MEECLDKMLCFKLYVCSKEIIKKYQPFLAKYDLSYTQYITMVIMWKYDSLSEKELGKKLFLDSGTLTPLLKKLEKKEYIKRTRSKSDERVLNIELTNKGKELKNELQDIPSKVGACLKLNNNDNEKLNNILDQILKSL